MSLNVGEYTPVNDFSNFVFEENAPEVNTDSLTRYGMSVLMPVDLRGNIASNAFGDFNPKTTSEYGKRFNAVNIPFFPPMTLMPFFGVTVDIPVEIPAKIVKAGSVESMPDEFDVESARSLGGRRKMTKSARRCLEDVMLDYEDTGFVSFDDLMGEDIKEVRKLIEIVYAQYPRFAIPVTERRKLEFPVKGPFLDEIRNYFKTTVETRIKDATRHYDLKAPTVEKLHYVKEVVILGTETAWKFANSTLDSSEAMMSAKEKEKAGYDQPERRFKNSPVPLDIYLLAHTNRNPLELKQVEAAQAMSQGMAQPLVNLMEKVIENSNGNGVNMAKIEEMFAKQEEEFAAKQAEMAEKLKLLEEERALEREAFEKKLKALEEQKATKRNS